MAELEVDRGRVDEAVLGLTRLGLHEADRFSPLAKVRRRLEESAISEPEFIEILKAAQIRDAKREVSSEYRG